MDVDWRLYLNTDLACLDYNEHIFYISPTPNLNFLAPRAQDEPYPIERPSRIVSLPLQSEVRVAPPALGPTGPCHKDKQVQFLMPNTRSVGESSFYISALVTLHLILCLLCLLICHIYTAHLTSWPGSYSEKSVNTNWADIITTEQISFVHILKYV